MGGIPVSEIFRGASGLVGLANEEEERASTGEVFANECRAGRIGLEVLVLGKLKLPAAGDPARDIVIDSCCAGISNPAGLLPNV